MQLVEQGARTETVVHYVTDTRASQFTAQAYSAGLLSAFGHGDVLDTSNYPEIVYECSKIRAAETGEGEYQVTLNAI